MTACGCPGASVVGPITWHLHPVTCTSCAVLVRGTHVTAGGLHLCPPCARGVPR